MKESLGFAEGVVSGIGRDHGDAKEHKVFDWLKAAWLIKEHCKVGDLFKYDAIISAGLKENWECTSGEIFANGSIVSKENSHCFLASSWATPIIDIDGNEHECWKYRKDTYFDSDTYWPDEALKSIFNTNTKSINK